MYVLLGPERALRSRDSNRMKLTNRISRPEPPLVEEEREEPEHNLVSCNGQFPLYFCFVK